MSINTDYSYIMADQYDQVVAGNKKVTINSREISVISKNPGLFGKFFSFLSKKPGKKEVSISKNNLFQNRHYVFAQARQELNHLKSDMQAWMKEYVDDEVNAKSNALRGDQKNLKLLLEKRIKNIQSCINDLQTSISKKNKARKKWGVFRFFIKKRESRKSLLKEVQSLAADVERISKVIKGRSDYNFQIKVLKSQLINLNTVDDLDSESVKDLLNTIHSTCIGHVITHKEMLREKAQVTPYAGDITDVYIQEQKEAKIQYQQELELVAREVGSKLSIEEKLNLLTLLQSKVLNESFRISEGKPFRGERAILFYTLASVVAQSMSTNELDEERLKVVLDHLKDMQSQFNDTYPAEQNPSLEVYSNLLSTQIMNLEFMLEPIKESSIDGFEVCVSIEDYNMLQSEAKSLTEAFRKFESSQLRLDHAYSEMENIRTKAEADLTLKVKLKEAERLYYKIFEKEYNEARGNYESKLTEFTSKTSLFINKMRLNLHRHRLAGDKSLAENLEALLHYYNNFTLEPLVYIDDLVNHTVEVVGCKSSLKQLSKLIEEDSIFNPLSDGSLFQFNPISFRNIINENKVLDLGLDIDKACKQLQNDHQLSASMGEAVLLRDEILSTLDTSINVSNWNQIEKVYQKFQALQNITLDDSLTGQLIKEKIQECESLLHKVLTAKLGAYDLDIIQNIVGEHDEKLTYNNVKEILESESKNPDPIAYQHISLENCFDLLDGVERLKMCREEYYGKKCITKSTLNQIQRGIAENFSMLSKPIFELQGDFKVFLNKDAYENLMETLYKPEAPMLQNVITLENLNPQVNDFLSENELDTLLEYLQNHYQFMVKLETGCQEIFALSNDVGYEIDNKQGTPINSLTNNALDTEGELFDQLCDTIDRQLPAAMKCNKLIYETLDGASSELKNILETSSSIKKARNELMNVLSLESLSLLEGGDDFTTKGTDLYYRENGVLNAYKHSDDNPLMIMPIAQISLTQLMSLLQTHKGVMMDSCKVYKASLSEDLEYYFERKRMIVSVMNDIR